jgi:carbonic anhydrase/acetyltransferase-like protein (isoleucine patch superfamily)
MDNIVAYKNKSPQIDPSAYINPFAIVIGDVSIAEGVSLWPGAIIRADDDSIEIGAHTAVLDRVMIEAPRGHPVKVGENALLSHGAVLHGCTVEEGVLIGISANILDGAVIGKESVIAAGALVPSGTVVPPRSKVMGVPGKITAEVIDSDVAKIQEERLRIIENAKDYGSWFVAGQM